MATIQTTSLVNVLAKAQGGQQFYVYITRTTYGGHTYESKYGAFYSSDTPPADQCFAYGYGVSITVSPDHQVLTLIEPSATFFHSDGRMELARATLTVVKTGPNAAHFDWRAVARGGAVLSQLSGDFAEIDALTF